MSAIAPAGFGGRYRYEPAALPPCADDFVHLPALLAAAGALLVTLLLTGSALPQAEWFALPERIDEMRERPGEFWRHFVGLLLALCGLDTVSDLAGVVGKPIARPAGRMVCVVAVKALMLHALLVLAVGSLLSDPQLGDGQMNLLPFVPTEYAGQWGEIVVALVGEFLLVSSAGVTGWKQQIEPRSHDVREANIFLFMPERDQGLNFVFHPSVQSEWH